MRSNAIARNLNIHKFPVKIKRLLFQYYNAVSGARFQTFTCLPYTFIWGRRGRHRMVIRFTTTYAISAYHHWSILDQGEVYNIMW